MGQGRTAYLSYVRIHEEMGLRVPPEWESLTHVRRMAWEAAAQAVALQVVPNIFGADFFAETLEEDPEDLAAVECESNVHTVDAMEIQE